MYSVARDLSVKTQTLSTIYTRLLHKVRLTVLSCTYSLSCVIIWAAQCMQYHASNRQTVYTAQSWFPFTRCAMNTDNMEQMRCNKRQPDWKMCHKQLLNTHLLWGKPLCCQDETNLNYKTDIVTLFVAEAKISLFSLNCLHTAAPVSEKSPVPRRPLSECVESIFSSLSCRNVSTCSGQIYSHTFSVAINTQRLLACLMQGMSVWSIRNDRITNLFHLFVRS